MIRRLTKNFFDLYLSPRVLSIVFFAFPYGMMFFLNVTTLQVWLKEVGLDKTKIGFVALVSIPYVLKFLWAPLVDVVKLPWLHHLGQRRSWLIFIHSSLVLFIILMGFSSPSQSNIFGMIAFMIAFLSATQDIIIDAYRIEILNKKESIQGISMLIFGYRLGSLTAKAGPLYLAHHFSWPIAYIIMALLVGMGIIATLMNPEPLKVGKKVRSLYETVVLPFQEFIYRSKFCFLVFIFIILYRFGDAMINNMASVFYLETGFTKVEIASAAYLFGTGAAIIGGFLGAFVTKKLGVYKSLLFCGILHTLSNLMFIVLAVEGYSILTLYIAIALENITGGMSTAVFFVYLSRLCHLNYTVTQFALLTSLWSLATPLASISGWIIDKLEGNWIQFFLITVLAALPGLVLIFFLPKYKLGNDGAKGPSPS